MKQMLPALIIIGLILISDTDPQQVISWEKLPSGTYIILNSEKVGSQKVRYLVRDVKNPNTQFAVLIENTYLYEERGAQFTVKNGMLEFNVFTETNPPEETIPLYVPDSQAEKVFVIETGNYEVLSVSHSGKISSDGKTREYVYKLKSLEKENIIIEASFWYPTGCSGMLPHKFRYETLAGGRSSVVEIK